MSYGQNIPHIFDFILILIAYAKYYQFNNMCFDKTKMIYLSRTQVNRLIFIQYVIQCGRQKPFFPG
mgnify:CR=1 FL=1